MPAFILYRVARWPWGHRSEGAWNETAQDARRADLGLTTNASYGNDTDDDQIAALNSETATAASTGSNNLSNLLQPLPIARDHRRACGVFGNLPQSGRRDSNAQRSAWKADALPLSYARNHEQPHAGLHPSTGGLRRVIPEQPFDQSSRAAPDALPATAAPRPIPKRLATPPAPV